MFSVMSPSVHMCPPMDKSYSTHSSYSSSSEDSVPSMGPYDMYGLMGNSLEMGMQQLSPVYSASVESSYFGSPATPEPYHDYVPPMSYSPDMYAAVNMYQNFSSVPSHPWAPMQEPCYSETMTPEPCDMEMYSAGSEVYEAPLEVIKPIKPFGCVDCGRAFTRPADLRRHQTSVHNPVPEDCPVENCPRKASNGFPRRDHLKEHLRSYHHIDVPKRSKRVTKTV
ncbi:hypothetical protein P168DRAFT_325463 [Aspergillus campestris IBT 28561]|uniref:C2H2-type domain-containing protein n=1 Tax=Aspergillus campestris (strain IBT 28561) TaxID=1392248 RepID=A0A2I1D9Q3_ASPC2|nr:uncharacterized protein P168DRAFT_325463 [Aspergillus campestris IBT 28561]PKY06613.1 hypothetical protein P168DRAFT_325463 [Aspergillus campestris IBT 28561]